MCNPKCVYDMYCLCMIATIPLATGNKLNCFISASGNVNNYLTMRFCVWFPILTRGTVFKRYL